MYIVPRPNWDFRPTLQVNMHTKELIKRHETLEQAAKAMKAKTTKQIQECCKIFEGSAVHSSLWILEDHAEIYTGEDGKSYVRKKEPYTETVNA